MCFSGNTSRMVVDMVKEYVGIGDYRYFGALCNWPLISVIACSEPTASARVGINRILSHCGGGLDKFVSTSESTLKFLTSHISNIRIIWRSNFKMYERSDVHTFWHPYVQTFRCSDICTFIRSYVQSFAQPYVQMFRRKAIRSEYKTIINHAWQNVIHIAIMPLISMQLLQTPIQHITQSSFQSYYLTTFCSVIMSSSQYIIISAVRHINTSTIQQCEISEDCRPIAVHYRPAKSKRPIELFLIWTGFIYRGIRLYLHNGYYLQVFHL